MTIRGCCVQVVETIELELLRINEVHVYDLVRKGKTSVKMIKTCITCSPLSN